MATKKSAKGACESLDDAKESVGNIKLTILEAKRNALFSRMQAIYDMAKTAHENEENKKMFLNSLETLEDINLKFESTLDQYNEALLSYDPNAVPNYQAYSSFVDLYCYIKGIAKQLTITPSPASTAPRRAYLPPIELVSFDGDIKNWPLFYASFKSTVDDNKSLTNDEKLYYLIGKLSPKVQSIFAGISPCGENYQIILQSLTDRYKDIRCLASSYIDQISNTKLTGSSSAVNYELFIDKIITAVNALTNLKIDNLADFLLFHISIKKLDIDTIRAFENTINPGTLPTFSELAAFIRKQHKVFTHSAVLSNNSRTVSAVNSYTKPHKKSVAPNIQTYITSTVSMKCLCENIDHDHYYKCPQFHSLSPSGRFKFIKEHNACINCLSSKHKVSKCKSNLNCRICKKRHHSLLHLDNKPVSPSLTTPHAQQPPPPVTATEGVRTAGTYNTDALICATSFHAQSSQGLISNKYECSSPSIVLLSTAQVVVYDTLGNKHLIRCLLDSASQSNFISESCCKRLGINDYNNYSFVVRGIGGSEKPIKGHTEIKFYSRFNSELGFNISALVIDKITDNLPSVPVDISMLSHFNSLALADDTYFKPGTVDILIGASLFPHLLLSGKVMNENSPSAINTVLGYVIMGSIPGFHSHNTYTSFCCTGVQESIDTTFKRFCELEEVATSPAQSKDDIQCEEFFRSTTVRKESGRYIVALPFKEDINNLGDSYTTARRRFLCLENKLQASPSLRTAYDDVIRDYIDKQYLRPALADNCESRPVYYIPHHGVVRNDKSTTKLRVVLDASCKSSTNVSLNDLMYAGPNLQGDLFSIILNFRLFAVALSADCRQMYLQIGMRESDWRFQRILYRFNPLDAIKVYEFTRVCFGMKASPYLALRVVQQLIIDEGSKFPAATNILANSIYMDDIVFSVMNEPQAIEASHQLINLFKRGGFDLVKWISNSQSVLNSLPASHKSPKNIEFDTTVQQKILGLHWDQYSDCFYFKVITPCQGCTKRTILSTIAQLWDIMGFVAPVILQAKLFIKELWSLKCDWDDCPPQHIVISWNKFCSELPALNEMRIPRHLGVYENSVITLVGFADASERAYGGVVYLHITNNNNTSVQFVCAKSKVSPLKILTVARLELCAALLLSKLLRLVFNNYNSRHKIDNIFAFSDSKVALCWINSAPHRWQTFVANRVAKITDNVPASSFFHVAGVENPADCLSRGLSPAKLINHPLWLCGPSWMSGHPSDWPLNKPENISLTEIPDQKLNIHVSTADTKDSIIYSLSNRCSSYSKLLRIIVYVCRFLKLLPRTGNASVASSDINAAEIRLIRVLQNIYFFEDFKRLKDNETCSPTLLKLKPFLDDQGLLRVGGRLSNSIESYTYKHPYVLPRNDHIVDLLIDMYHKKYLHAGPETLMSLLRQRYWILAARRIIRLRINKCNVCFRSRPRPTLPIMSDLPSQRVNQMIKAFSHTGCDYAGPLFYTPYRARGVRSRKAWLCIFSCLTTRAIHIELATELSTAAFLAALKRFLSRRGPIQCMYSDHGTNFVGARTYLKDIYKFLDDFRPHFETELTENRIEWKFMPPSAPHFGGCWESMVKIVKTHLFRVVGKQILSYEELLTILAQIEALINSRPLTTLSSDPAEPSALTPAHFLNTVPLSSIPALEVDNTPTNLMKRHALLDHMVQSFWKRWRLEYLHQLQSRSKWTTRSSSIQVGTVVVLIIDNQPTFSWPLGVVEAVHPSKDGTIRVVTVRTSKGSFVRPTVKVCPLPTN